MGIKTYKPTSPGRRFGSVLSFEEITKTQPEKSLCEPKKNRGGRNHHGHTTARFRGGGHKRLYRRIDFKRDKDGVPAKVHSIEYDPNRSANIALLHYADGEKRYILAPLNLEVGQTIISGPQAEARLGNAIPLSRIPAGLIVHNVELEPGKGGQLARSAGTYARLVAKEGNHAILVLPSGEQRRVHIRCRATLGQLGNLDWQNITYGKAGRVRWLGRRPHNRGTSMNPVAHPMGGGEGRKAGGRHPCSPSGVLAKGGKTRRPRNPSNTLIIRRRRKKRKKR
jgi:large subunit ribosomal protein L2